MRPPVDFCGALKTVPSKEAHSLPEHVSRSYGRQKNKESLKPKGRNLYQQNGAKLSPNNP